MCHQTVSLVQSELERCGIVTVSLTLMPDVTRKLAPPRALSVAALFGAPLGPPHDRQRHQDVLREMLALVGRQDVPVIARSPDDA